MKKVLVTGAAGFIGFHLVKRLLLEKIEVVGLDNINDYYDVNLKYARLAECGIYAPEDTIHNGGENRTYQRIEFNKIIKSELYDNYRFVRLDLEDKAHINDIFTKEAFDYVFNLAAQAGVRYSIENPDVYIQSNIVGFLNILEACRQYPVDNLVFASSSSVYGNNSKVPFSVDEKTDNPISLYAATKKSNELMAYTYNHLYKVPIVGLRFFTVYGPWGRPDMAPMLFADAILNDKPIKVFNNGQLERDFTFIDDIVEGLFRTSSLVSNKKNSFNIMNIGNGQPINLMQFIKTMEEALGRTAKKIMLPMQPGDVNKTWAETSQLEKAINYTPKINILEGIHRFTLWYKSFYSK